MSLQTEAFAAGQAAVKRAEERFAPMIASWIAALSRWNKDVSKYDPAKLGNTLRAFYELHRSTASAVSGVSSKACGRHIADFYERTTDEPLGYLCDLGERQNLFADAAEWIVESGNAVKEFGKYIEQCDSLAAANARLPAGRQVAIEIKNLKPVINRCVMSMYHALVAAHAAGDIRITSWMGKAVLSVVGGDFIGFVSSIGSGVLQGLGMVASAALGVAGRAVGFAADLATDALFAVLKKVGIYAAIGIGGYVAIKRYSNGKPLWGN